MPYAVGVTIRIAMWSGPRNISTALMRSWESRADCAVTDEPLYGHYLSTLDPGRRAAHPGAGEVMASQSTDWREVAAALTGPVPGGRPVWYQKHMAHHLSPGMDTGWVHGLTNCFLIRDPAAMIASFAKVIPDPRPEDLGLPQQVALFEAVRTRTGRVPGVIDAADVLADPPTALAGLCRAVGAAWDPAMLSWAPGPRETDGVWGPHWYGRVYTSTGFERAVGEAAEVPARLRGVLEACEGMYGALVAHRL